MEQALRKRNGGGLSRLQDEMNDLFGRFFGDRNLIAPDSTFWPTIDVADTIEAIVVRAELPGCKPEDVQVSVQKNTMTISGEKKETSEEKRDNFYHVESRYGSFRRDLMLPAEVNTDKIVAECKNGVLSVTLPKEEKAKAKQIKIQG